MKEFGCVPDGADTAPLLAYIKQSMKQYERMTTVLMMLKMMRAIGLLVDPFLMLKERLMTIFPSAQSSSSSTSLLG